MKKWRRERLIGDYNNLKCLIRFNQYIDMNNNTTDIILCLPQGHEYIGGPLDGMFDGL